MTSGREVADLRALAGSCGVQMGHRGMAGQGSARRAGEQALRRALGAWGCPVEREGDAAAHLRRRQVAFWRRLAEPVVVAWEGRRGHVMVRSPRGGRGRLALELVLEDGARHAWTPPPADGAARVTHHRVDGEWFEARRVALPAGLPAGYHRLIVSRGPARVEAVVIAAPRTVWTGPEEGRLWGVFVPLYAMASRGGWGAGSYAGFERLGAWVAARGGHMVATLPLLACFLGEELHNPSPYAPVSRLFWNEFFLDVERLPELQACAAAKRLLGSAGVRETLRRHRHRPVVSWREGMSLRRRILEPLAACLFSADTPRRRALEQHRAEHPELERYAMFRAVCERQGRGWPAWPARLRDGNLRAGDAEPASVRYHVYAQWAASGQIQEAAASARSSGPGLFLDLPLGVHPDGFDVWRERESFAMGARTGAPPDSFFTRGQNWGFPPLHPERLRETGYRYVAGTLRHSMRHAGMLRLDHVMALHRLWWIPEGLEASSGVYVRYRPDEMYAVVALESHRARCLVAGEDLGTVPAAVGNRMGRHRLLRSFVLQYELPGVRPGRLPAVPARSIASINTHDMPAFASFVRGDDIDDRRSLGLLDDREARAETRARAAMVRGLASALRRSGHLRGRGGGAPRLLNACLSWLGASPARVVVAGLEDLWGERRPQNTPGTSVERRNWQRRTLYNLETFTKMRSVRGPLARLDRARRQEGS
jgi:4-alpha-glucanotransferase